MSDETLSTYRNDHLAGSVGAVAMVERVIEENAGTLFGRRLEEILKGRPCKGGFKARGRG